MIFYGLWEFKPKLRENEKYSKEYYEENPKEGKIPEICFGKSLNLKRRFESLFPLEIE
jgi:hypothetical protein